MSFRALVFFAALVEVFRLLKQEAINVPLCTEQQAQTTV